MSQQRLHRRIEAITLLELDGKTLREIACANARGIEALQNGEHGLDLAKARPQLFRDRCEVAIEIAGLIDQIDEVLPDHAAGRIGERERELLGKMVGERGLDRHESFEIVVGIVAPPRPRAGPFGVTHRPLAVATRERGIGIGGSNIVDIEGGLIWGCVAVSKSGRLHPIGRAGLGRDVRVGGIPSSVAFSSSLEQRIAFELPFHICGQVQIGELQQLDGLHQLRRHYEGMALPKLESLGKRHGHSETAVLLNQIDRKRARGAWSNSCLSPSWPAVYQD